MHYTTPEKKTIPSMQTSRVGEAVEVHTNTVCQQSDGERLLVEEGIIVVRIDARRYNNQCGPLQRDIDFFLQNSTQEERHAGKKSVSITTMLCRTSPV